MRLLWYFLQQNTKSIIYYIYLLINALQIFLSQEWYFETFLSKKTIKQPTTLPIFFTSSIRTWLLLNPLEKVIFDNFFICNHLIIKWHFVGKRTKNYFLKWAHYWSFASFCPTRPEGAEALSPGYRPGLLRTQTWRPVRAKALKLLIIYKAFALTCRAQLRNV